MEKISFFSTIFISSIIASMTFYSIYIGFGPLSKNLRDPFEEHED
uniref:Protein PsbN n=1 Tax=Euglenaformis proxima TaxID=299110 RepID=A0A023HHS3_9EUGL|nr:photosystem II N protein [Euglenaformis proxima]AGL12031.1 photosystem II N protein [Euglenaformis proxima]